MTGKMSMNQIIHAAVRRDVARTGQALRRLREGDAERARGIQTAWRNLVRELTHHHEAEDELLWPFLQARGVELSLLEEMEAEHVAMKAALASVSASLESLVAAPTAANATAAADEVDRAELVINGHLDHEERDVEAPMGDLEDDPEFKELAKKLRPASIGRRRQRAGLDGRRRRRAGAYGPPVQHPRPRRRGAHQGRRPPLQP